MPDIFTNIKFYASKGADGIRTPTSTKFEDVVIPDPVDPAPTDPVDPVDPVDPDPPTSPPVDIPAYDPPTSEDVTPTYDFPTLSRKSHSKDIYAQSGSVLSITYVSDVPCTIVPKLWFEDVKVFHAKDGKSMTIEWQVPDDEPARSLHVGAKAEFYGSDTSTSNDVVLYDRLHVNKSPSDIVWCGIGESITQIMTALNTVKSGQTLIVRNGTYTGDNNRIFIGNKDGNYFNNGFESGVFKRITAIDYYKGIEYKTTKVEVSKFTTVMAEDPLEVTIDGEHTRHMGYLAGTQGYEYAGQGDYTTKLKTRGNELVGVEITGFFFLNNFPNSSILYHTEKCGFFNNAYVASTTHADNAVFGGGDGPTVNFTGGCEQKHERFFMITNSRQGMSTGSRKVLQPLEDKEDNGAIRQFMSAYESDFSKVWFTPACIQMLIETQSYGIENYGGLKMKHHNMFSIDNAFYVDGMRSLLRPDDGAAGTDTFFTYQAVNTDSEFLTFWGIGQYNSGRQFIELDTSTDTGVPNLVDNYLALHFTSTISGGYGPLTYLNNNDQILRGVLARTNVYDDDDAIRASSGGIPNISAFNSYKLKTTETRPLIDGMLLSSISWDYPIKATDTVFFTGTNFSTLEIDRLAVIDAPPRLVAGVKANASPFVEYSATQAVAAGAQYATKVEKDSQLDKAGVGCEYHFATRGRYLSYYNDKDSDTIYKDINWLSRSMWEKWQELNRLYLVTSNGLDFDGNQGWALSNMHPVDYINRHGPTPLKPVNAPYIDDIYATLNQDLTVTLFWRPVCPAYRSTISGYHIYMNGVKIIDTIDKAATKATINTIPSGQHRFNIVVIDTTYGNSGLSKDVYVGVPINPPPVQAPDPSDPNSGGDDGGYIGDIGASPIITVGTAPNISRKSHGNDIYVSSGQSMSITYVIDGEGTLLPKGGYEDMQVIYSADGREMKLVWPCPVGEAGDSTYVGAEVWGYGEQDSDEAVSILWDRLHINKSNADIVFCGPTRQYKTITAAAEALMIRKGMTLVVDNGYYADRDDWVNFGFVRDSYGSVWAGVQRGELHGYINDSHLYDSANSTGNSYQAALVKKYAVFMSATPCGAVLDRAGKYGGINLFGNGAYSSSYEGSNGFSGKVEGVKVVGFAIRNAATSANFDCAQRVGMSYCSFVQDNSYDDSSSAIFDGSGSCIKNRATANTLFENNNILGNSRTLCSNVEGNYGAFKSVWRANIATSGCIMFGLKNNTSQTFEHDGAHNVELFNCIAIDSAFFSQGYQISQDKKPDFDYTFSASNTINNNIVIDQCMAINDVRAGLRINGSGEMSGNPDLIKNSVFWNRIYLDETVTPSTGRFMLSGSGAESEKSTEYFKNISVGRNPNYYKQGYGYSLAFGVASMENMLFSSPAWGALDGTSLEEFITSEPTVWAGNNAFTCNYSPSSDIIFNANPVQAARNQADDLGFIYISRIEESSTFEGLNVGCKNAFVKVGRYGKFYGEDGYNTRFDGIEAPYVNALSRMPWLEFRHERQQYSCKSNGVTYSGKVGWAINGGNPIDYINRLGTTPEKPLNCPYIEDIYAVSAGAGKVRIAWRPPAPIFRKTIAGYLLYIDGVKTTPDNNVIPKNATSIPLENISSGERSFNLVVIDPTYGNSGFSRTIKVTVV